MSIFIAIVLFLIWGAVGLVYMANNLDNKSNWMNKGRGNVPMALFIVFIVGGPALLALALVFVAADAWLERGKV